MDWRDIPSLSALRAFEAAARLQSYSGAARELNVTHAAVAQHVRTLEAHFGQGLMERQGRAMVPTVAGRRLAHDLFNGFSEIAGGVRALAAARGDGPISLTTTPTFAENWLMPRLARFWAERPDIPLTIAPDERVRDLRRDGHHLAIRYGRGKWPGVEAEFLVSADTVVVGHPELAARLPVDYAATAPNAAEKLTALPWLVDTSYGELRSWLLDQGLDADALKATSLAGNSLVLAATRAGAGLSMQPTALVSDDIEAGRLVSLLEHCCEELGYFILQPPGPVPDRVKVFLEWLRQA